jgi:hypothetical protein
MKAIVFRRTFREWKRYQRMAMECSCAGFDIDKEISSAKEYVKCEVPVIFGPWERRKIIDCRTSVAYTHQGDLMHLDCPLIGPRHPDEISHIRVGLNRWLWLPEELDNESDRWPKVSRELGLSSPQNFAPKGEDILVACDRIGSKGFFYKQFHKWIDNTINNIRKFSNRKIIIRAKHGGGRIALKREYLNTEVFNEKNQFLEVEDLNFWAIVARRGGMATKSVLAGVPTFTNEPANHAYCVSEHTFENIESPVAPDLSKSDWLNKIAHVTWSFEEMKNGNMWSFFKRYWK